MPKCPKCDKEVYFGKTPVKYSYLYIYSLLFYSKKKYENKVKVHYFVV